MESRHVKRPITNTPLQAGPCTGWERAPALNLIVSYPFLLALLASVRYTNKMGLTDSFHHFYCGYQKFKERLHFISGGQCCLLVC